MNACHTVRTKTVLVFGTGDNAVAVVTHLVVHAGECTDMHRLRFTGCVTFDERLKQHLRRILLPLVDRICRLLGVPLRRFDISAVNIGAASATDRAITLSGHSADAPLFTGMLAAACQLSPLESVVSTGHIASQTGDIRFVKNIPAKLQAAINDPDISIFLYPSAGADDSVKRLMPDDADAVRSAVQSQHGKISVVAIEHVGDLARAAFDELTLLLGSLRADYFGRFLHPSTRNDFAWRTAVLLASEGRKRTNAQLTTLCLEGNGETAGTLAAAFLDYHIRHRIYPAGFGRELRGILRSVPPATRRLKLRDKLLTTKQCVEVAAFAAEDDFDDVQHLFALASQAVASWSEEPAPDPQAPVTPDSADRTLTHLLREISPERLSEKVGAPIDLARASFVMETITVRSNQEFLDTIASFYLHLLRHTETIVGNREPDLAIPDALDLVKRAFRREGEYRGALAEAKDRIRGGLRYVLDRMTEQFKSERQEDYVLYLFQTAIDPLDWDFRVAFIAEFLKRCAQHLPEQIRNAPPERYAQRYQEIVRAYLQSNEPLKRLLKSI